MEKYLEVDDVLNKVRHSVTNIDAYHFHSQNHSLDQYYKDTLVEAVTTMSLLPVDREFEGMEPLENTDEISKGFSQIAEMIAITFIKQQVDVNRDLTLLINSFPMKEVHQSRILGTTNKLH